MSRQPTPPRLCRCSAFCIEDTERTGRLCRLQRKRDAALSKASAPPDEVEEQGLAHSEQAQKI